MRLDVADTAGEGSVGSGLETAVFKLSARPPMTFDDGTDALQGLVTSREGRVSMKLDAADFEGREGGPYWITAKTVDRAGNVQIQNQPLRVDWRVDEKPSAKPTE